MIIPNEESIIIQISMFGLGLLIAIYTLVYPKIEKLMEEQAKEVVECENKFNKQLEKELSNHNKDVRDKIKKLNEFKDEIDQVHTPPYELFWGFIIPLAFFSFPIIKIALDNLGTPIFSSLDNELMNFVCGGMLALVLLFILIFVRLHSLAMKNFDKVVKDIRDKTNQKLKDIEED